MSNGEHKQCSQSSPVMLALPTPPFLILEPETVHLISKDWLYQDQTLAPEAIPLHVAMLTAHVRWFTERLEALEHDRDNSRRGRYRRRALGGS